MHALHTVIGRTSYMGLHTKTRDMNVWINIYLCFTSYFEYEGI